MDIFEWKDEYSIHNEHLDNQHKKLFEIAKRADNMVKEQIDSQEVKKVILELFNYMKTHFHDEELYMESIGYSKLREHKEIHKEIIRRIAGLIKNIKYDFKHKLASQTKEWLVEHIMKEDLDIYKWNISKDNGLEVDINNASDIIMKHYYRCECRDSFNVPDSLHQAVMEGKNYVCKNCKQRIVFVMDSSY